RNKHSVRGCSEDCTPRRLLFLLHYCRRPRAPHSFPTRRSSDLQTDCSQSSPNFVTMTFAVTQNFSLLNGGDLFLKGQQPGSGNTDRKSTRLNSSHLGISYAVFCLKKKSLTAREAFAARLPVVTY